MSGANENAMKPIKAVAKESSNEPFYLIQSNGLDKRYVVSLRDKVTIKALFGAFINQSEDTIQVKIIDFEEYEGPIDYSGEISKGKLHELMIKHEEVLFHNGYHDFMLKYPGSGDIMVFDEHGLIFIYTSLNYADVLSNFNVAYKPDEKLLYEYNHWHYCLHGGREKLTDMIKDFELEKEGKYSLR